MKIIISILTLTILWSCSTIKQFEYSDSFWGELASDETYLYTGDSLTSIVDKIVKKGTILFFYQQKGDFFEIYTDNPKHLTGEESKKKARFYLYKPKYITLKHDKRTDHTRLYELPFDPNKAYLSGERGGCYYINENGHKTYVNRSYCDNSKKHKEVNKRSSSNGGHKKSSSSCSAVQCSGKTQKGTRCRNKTTNCSGRCHLH